jgi:hypothetical protein
MGRGIMQQESAIVLEKPAAEKPETGPRWWTRLRFWDRQLSAAKGFTLVTLLAGFFGGYFQYLNAYQQQVGTLAKADMETATAAFVDISNAFAEAQMLQQLLFQNFSAAIDATGDAGNKAMTTQDGNDNYGPYTKARIELRQNSQVFARKAEIYIDWASDLGRDPATPRVPGSDPLTEWMLGKYDFDCDAEANMPYLAVAETTSRDDPETACTAGVAQWKPAQRMGLCARKPAAGRVDDRKPSVTIDWQSTKHHLLTMHYCFEQAHRQIATARIWASQNPVSNERVQEFRDDQDRLAVSLNRQAVRLNAFMSLTMAHLESIHVKYRPAGFFCHVPVVRDAIGLFSARCTPVRAN